MARSARQRSDRPHEPQLPDELTGMDLGDLDWGQCEAVLLGGSLPAGFDEPLVLTQARLQGAALAGAGLSGSRLIDVEAAACDLTGADLDEAALTRVRFVECRMTSAQLTRTRLRDVTFVRCRMDEVNLASAGGERVRFEGCRMERADLREARFDGVAWWDCDLRDADVTRIQLARGQLQGSNLGGLRGGTSLRDVGIDADQFGALAEHVLASMGIVVRERDGG
jgi:uncharacterized protein YjbI with pentapeptide repeats